MLWLLVVLWRRLIFMALQFFRQIPRGLQSYLPRLFNSPIKSKIVQRSNTFCRQYGLSLFLPFLEFLSHVWHPVSKLWTQWISLGDSAMAMSLVELSQLYWSIRPTGTCSDNPLKSRIVQRRNTFCFCRQQRFLAIFPHFKCSSNGWHPLCKRWILWVFFRNSAMAVRLKELL